MCPNHIIRFSQIDLVGNFISVDFSLGELANFFKFFRIENGTLFRTRSNPELYIIRTWAVFREELLVWIDIFSWKCGEKLGIFVTITWRMTSKPARKYPDQYTLWWQRFATLTNRSCLFSLFWYRKTYFSNYSPVMAIKWIIEFALSRNCRTRSATVLITSLGGLASRLLIWKD